MATSFYRGLRSDDLLKVKTHDDAEARVVAHLPGQGKYQDVVGALLVESADGRRFRLGSGLSAAERRAPPPIGTWITYRFRGLNPSGMPRFRQLSAGTPGHAGHAVAAACGKLR